MVRNIREEKNMTQSNPEINRRAFLCRSTAATMAVGFSAVAGEALANTDKANDRPLFKLSLAQWSLHRTFRGQGGEERRDPLEFAQISKEMGINAIEYVNQFFMDKANDSKYLKELKTRSDDHEVKNLLIMCDREGRLGDPDNAKRKQAVENHHKWVEAAKTLGCHSIRVNAASAGSYEEQQKLAADGLLRLTEFGAKHDISVIVENHGGLSSNGAWLAGVMKMVDHPACGTLPDFGNFAIDRKTNKWYDRYKGVAELMPYAKAVSAKTHGFDTDGDEVYTDYIRIMKIVLDAGYHGFVGIEYEGPGRPEHLEKPRVKPAKPLNERDGILASKKLLLKVRKKLSRKA